MARLGLRSDGGIVGDALDPAQPLRVVVIGMSGSGKTTFATHLASATGLPHLELDLINWRANWYNRYVEDFEAFAADVEAATSGDNWVLAGNYTRVRARLMARANVVVWLDLPKPMVLRQVFSRSIIRAVDKKPILNGNRERFIQWVKKDHPIQIVWRNYERKRAAFEAELSNEDASHLTLYRCRSRRQVSDVLQTLKLHAARQADRLTSR